MLVHSPPFPLVINYFEKYGDVTAEAEDEITHALEQRDRSAR
jgi:hypothetical protein